MTVEDSVRRLRLSIDYTKADLKQRYYSNSRDPRIVHTKLTDQMLYSLRTCPNDRYTLRPGEFLSLEPKHSDKRHRVSFGGLPISRDKFQDKPLITLNDQCSCDCHRPQEIQPSESKEYYPVSSYRGKHPRHHQQVKPESEPKPLKYGRNQQRRPASAPKPSLELAPLNMPLPKFSPERSPKGSTGLHRKLSLIAPSRVYSFVSRIRSASVGSILGTNVEEPTQTRKQRHEVVNEGALRAAKISTRSSSQAAKNSESEQDFFAVNLQMAKALYHRKAETAVKQDAEPGQESEPEPEPEPELEPATAESPPESGDYLIQLPELELSPILESPEFAHSPLSAPSVFYAETGLLSLYDYSTQDFDNF